MLGGALENGFLVVAAERTQGIAERGPYLLARELALGQGAQAKCQSVTPRHPAPGATEDLGRARQRQPVVCEQRMDDESLLHGGHGARRRVGSHKGGLELRTARGLLDHRRHPAGALSGPALQALEAVDDLEGAVLERYHAQRQVGQCRLGARR